MGKRRKLSPKQLELERRRTRVLELYTHDIPIRQITEHINVDRVKAGLKPLVFQTIHHDLITALDEEAEYTSLKRRHHIQVSLRKLQKIESAHIGKLLKADKADDFDKWTKGFQRIWDRFDALLGTRKPEKIEVSGEGGGPIETVVTTRVIMPTVPNAADSEQEDDAP